VSQYDDGIDQRQYDDGANNEYNTDYEYVRTKHFYNWNSLLDTVSLHPDYFILNLELCSRSNNQS